jgi:hypothetical protein
MNLSKETQVLIHTKINVEKEKMISCVSILLAHIIMKNKLILKHLIKISKKNIENIKSSFNSSFNIHKEMSNFKLEKYFKPWLYFKAPLSFNKILML